MGQPGANAYGEVLEPGRVPDCYFGLRLDPPGHTEPAGVLEVAPAPLLHPAVPQPDGTVPGSPRFVAKPCIIATLYDPESHEFAEYGCATLYKVEQQISSTLARTLG